MIAALCDPKYLGGNTTLAPHFTADGRNRRDHGSLIDGGSPGAAFTWCEQHACRCVDHPFGTSGSDADTLRRKLSEFARHPDHGIAGGPPCVAATACSLLAASKFLNIDGDNS
jgi:hypothetical protein